MSKTSITSLILIIVVELGSAAFWGLLFGWFFGNMVANLGGGRPFEWDFDSMRAGALLGLIVFGPALNAIVFFFRRQYGIAIGSVIVLATLIILLWHVIPRIQDAKQAKEDADTSLEIAKRAIDGTDKKEYEDSVVYVLMVGHHLSLYEGTDIRLSEEKEKEVAECTAKLLTEDVTLSPRYTSYAWKTVYLNGEIYYYALNLYCDDGHFVDFYHMDKKRWESLGLDTPPETEPINMNLQFRK